MYKLITAVAILVFTALLAMSGTPGTGYYSDTDTIVLASDGDQSVIFPSETSGYTFQYDVGYFDIWTLLDEINGTIDSISVYWKFASKDDHWRPAWVDTASVDGATSNYIKFQHIDTSDSTWYHSIFFSPVLPTPIPLLRNSDSLQIKVQSTGAEDDSVGVRFELRYEAER